MTAHASLHIMFIVWIALCYFCAGNGQTCEPRAEQTSKCKCKYRDENGTKTRTFDFKPLSKKNGQPAFPFTAVPGDNYLYAYNPCYPFYEHCPETAACQLASHDDTFHYNIGDPYLPVYSVDTNGDIVITYTDSPRKSIVNFHCNETALSEAFYTPKGEDPPLSSIYRFTIDTCLACYEDIPGCYPEPTTSIVTTTTATTTQTMTTDPDRTTAKTNDILSSAPPSTTTADPEPGGIKLTLGEILSIALISLLVPFIVGSTVFMVHQCWRRRPKPDDTRHIMNDMSTA